MAWCCQATSHYLKQCWPRSLPPYGVTRPQWVNTLWPSDDIWCHRTWSTLVKVMACCLITPSHYLTHWWLIVKWTPGNNIHWNYNQHLNFYWRKCIWKSHLQNAIQSKQLYHIMVTCRTEWLKPRVHVWRSSCWASCMGLLHHRRYKTIHVLSRWYVYAPTQELLWCLLTHWGRDKMDTISQTTFSSAFSWMKIFEFG